MDKIPVYFMPGLAASSLIFEKISLPKDTFEMVFLEWEIPDENETLSVYTQRMVNKIKHENPALIGVSFGGILVQEMTKFITTRKVIIISSAKNNREFPKVMRFAKLTRIYKLLPTQMLLDLDQMAKFTFFKRVKERLPLYKRYLSVRDKKYLDWSIAQLLFWNRTESDKNVIHIHGSRDEVIPIKNIENCIVIEGGTHIMILNRFRWFNENLPGLIKG